MFFLLLLALGSQHATSHLVGELSEEATFSLQESPLQDNQPEALKLLSHGGLLAILLCDALAQHNGSLLPTAAAQVPAHPYDRVIGFCNLRI